MSEYRKKPVVIEAFQMTKERMRDSSDWPDWLNRAWQLPTTEIGSVFRAENDGLVIGSGYPIVCIFMLEGIHKVEYDDWIIKGVKGELYPCKPDIFALTYEAV